MNDQHEDLTGRRDPSTIGRRELIIAGAGMVASPLLAGAARAESPVGEGPYPARAYGVSDAKASFAPMKIERRALRPNDVLLDVLYSGICHSDIHIVRNEAATAKYPCVPEHEIVGRVAAVGKAVTKFEVGDVAGVGCMIDSCGTCESCRDDLEQYGETGWTLTFNTPDKVSGGLNYGGYADKFVVAERFAIRIPPGMDLASAAPLLCAGITTFSPLQHGKVEAGQRVGVIGLGGLGHIAVKLAAARRAEVTVFTTSPGKIADVKRMGAKEAVLWGDADAMKRLANRLDLIISTVPKGYELQPFLGLLRRDGTFVNVGVLDHFDNVPGRGLISRRRSLVGSLIGGIAETQQVVDYCAARNINPEVEVIRPDQIGQAYDRVVNKDLRYRFVIDMAQSKPELTNG